NGGGARRCAGGPRSARRQRAGAAGDGVVPVGDARGGGPSRSTPVGDASYIWFQDEPLCAGSRRVGGAGRAGRGAGRLRAAPGAAGGRQRRRLRVRAARREVRRRAGGAAAGHQHPRGRAVPGPGPAPGRRGGAALALREPGGHGAAELPRRGAAAASG
ncbi:unnamed protein product, partial [Prorocentrum cordatum]